MKEGGHGLKRAGTPFFSISLHSRARPSSTSARQPNLGVGQCPCDITYLLHASVGQLRATYLGTLLKQEIEMSRVGMIRN